MNWFWWTLTAILAVSQLGTIAMIGKPRTPITPATAVAGTVLAALLWIGVFVSAALGIWTGESRWVSTAFLLAFTGIPVGGLTVFGWTELVDRDD